MRVKMMASTSLEDLHVAKVVLGAGGWHYF